MRTARTLLGTTALGIVSGLMAGQTPTPSILIKQTDTVVGIGELTSVNYVGINSARNWSAVIDTSFADTNTDGALLFDGFVALREGTNLFNPPGSVLDDWLSTNLTENGNLGMLLQTKQGANTVIGAFWNLVPVCLQGTPVVDPNLTAGSFWDRFNVVKLNPLNEIFVMGDTKVGTTRNATLVRYRLGPTGAVLSSQVLAAKGMFIPPIGTVVTLLGTTEHVIALNDKGDFIVYIGAAGNNAVLINMDQVAAWEQHSSPIPGRNWKTLGSTKVSINNFGEYIVTGSVDGDTSTNYVVSKSGVKFAQQGDVIPTLSLAPLDSGAAAPLVITDNGDVFWGPRFQGANEESFARNYTPIVKRGQTVEGFLVSSVTIGENGFAVSRNGRFFVGRIELQGIGSTIVFADFGLIEEIPGCAGNQGRLTADTHDVRLGTSFTLSVDNAQAIGAIPVLAFSSGPARTDSPCGIMTPYGELLFSPPNTRTLLVLPTWNGTPVSTQRFTIPANVALIDATFYTQAAFFDPTVPSPEKYRLSNGLKIEIGAP